MNFQRQVIKSVAVLVLGWSIAFSGGCSDKFEKKAAKLAVQINDMRQETAKLKLRVASLEPLEKNLETCEEELAQANILVGKKKKEQKLNEARQKTIKQLLDKLRGVIEAGDLSIRIRRGRMVLEMQSAVLFPSGEASLSDKGMATLDSVAAVLKEINDRKFQVAGHTDNVPVGAENPFETNWHLSAARAISVVLHLRKKGLNPRNLSAAGYAQFQPIARNKTAKGKARNRRIEITLMPNLEELPDLSRMEKKLGLIDPIDGFAY